MSGAFGEFPEVERAILDVPQIRGVSALHLFERPAGGSVAVARVGLSPSLRLPEIVMAIAEAESRVRTAAPQVSEVFIEPDIAADSATPTETIVIRALD